MSAVDVSLRTRQWPTGDSSSACHAAVRFTLPSHQSGALWPTDSADLDIVGSESTVSLSAASSSLKVAPSCHVASSGNRNSPRRPPVPFEPNVHGLASTANGRKKCSRWFDESTTSSSWPSSPHQHAPVGLLSSPGASPFLPMTVGTFDRPYLAKSCTRWLPLSTTAITSCRSETATALGMRNWPGSRPFRPSPYLYSPFVESTCTRLLHVSATATASTFVLSRTELMRPGYQNSPVRPPSPPNCTWFFPTSLKSRASMPPRQQQRALQASRCVQTARAKG